jgi:hypothetical protein
MSKLRVSASGMEVWVALGMEIGPAQSALAALGEQFNIDRTSCIRSEAVREGFLQMRKGAMVRAAGVGAVQERAMNGLLTHFDLRPPYYFHRPAAAGGVRGVGRRREMMTHPTETTG